MERHDLTLQPHGGRKQPEQESHLNSCSRRDGIQQQRRVRPGLVLLSTQREMAATHESNLDSANATGPAVGRLAGGDEVRKARATVEMACALIPC